MSSLACARAMPPAGAAAARSLRGAVERESRAVAMDRGRETVQRWSGSSVDANFALKEKRKTGATNLTKTKQLPLGTVFP